MTCIVWDGECLAADRRITKGGDIVAQMVKIRRCVDGRLIGAAGSIDAVSALLNWLETGGDRPAFLSGPGEDNEGMEILPNGEIWLHLQHDKAKVCRGPQVLGSGAPFAQAAIACGKTAAEAVKIAAMFDTGTGGKVDCLALKE